MFELATPWALICLLLPLLIWFLTPRVALQLPSALKVPFYNAMLAIVDKKKPTLAGQAQIGLLFLIWCLLVFAAAGPRWVGEPRPLTREGRNIMLALDLSGSMELADMLMNGRPVSRLAVVKAAAEQFVQARVGDRIGLILFGTRAYLQTPLTYDRQSVLLRLDDATVGLAGQTTSIGDAIGLAVKRLQDVPAKGRMIILLTDGANNSGVLPPLKAAELAKLDNIKVYTIGLGAESDPRALGGAFFSPSPSSDLDEETLQEVAKITGGRYFRATDTQSLQAIYETINQLETVSQDQATIRPQHDYYPWPLAAAFILLLFWFSQRAGLLPHILRQEVAKA
ncbi:VWFA-related Acidobacterial domain protein [Legionella massiliensis]|uniref:VWFA-related Acidobacterial domain protein n=1 Tax=Legionella massiliensis TaxID=1034943 RepID=A0A078KWE9_9GAMM|nr:VWA domain-containing protein [Legionella massiliensis]CDZ76003.1 VWFA-related Acidobacterial domain protein [Legionella massiliensis]CEE11741.1 von Willebrand factor type A domain protein [Legionella massiliensis]